MYNFLGVSPRFSLNNTSPRRGAPRTKHTSGHSRVVSSNEARWAAKGWQLEESHSPSMKR